MSEQKSREFYRVTLNRYSVDGESNTYYVETASAVEALDVAVKSNGGGAEYMKALVEFVGMLEAKQ